MKAVTQSQARRLLHNKFVVVLGDSIQRSVYKDLVLLLQRDKYLSTSQLKTKGEMNFEQDYLVEGGQLGPMNNGTGYREVRQFRTDHHLVRFYFLTRIYSRYMESILADLENGLKPDVVVMNSCVWDLSRYGLKWVTEYRENLHKLFQQMKKILPPECLIMWNMTMPLGSKIIGGFLVPEIEHMAPTLRYDVIEANFYSATLADAYGLDVLDLHFHFRFRLDHRTRDGVHWNAAAHRRITGLLLQHAAQAWGVELPPSSAAAGLEFSLSSPAPTPAPLKSKRKQAQKTQQPFPHEYNNNYNLPPAMDPYRYGGPCGSRGYVDPYMEPPFPSNQQYPVLPWPQGPTIDYWARGLPPNFFCSDSPFSQMSTNTPYAMGYMSFNDHSSRFGPTGWNPGDGPYHSAPMGVQNHYVMKKKSSKKMMKPYSRQNQHHLCRY
ncbi:PC-esterase domain-containing protein 1A [Conger conger]|uniref:PC-esterase domain-containing protein 1A n=1 Tax=Conger conger TaxID=82655 RepID=UPI002A59B5A7|nr:PC-esterase domain-containing protein 1A [Conger conger]